MAARPEGPCGDRVHHRSNTIRVEGEISRQSPTVHRRTTCTCSVLTLYIRIALHIYLALFPLHYCAYDHT